MGTLYREGMQVQRSHRAFSLVELVIVVVIIGIISAIAVPRISSAAARSSSNALKANVATIRRSIDAYYAEHSAYPGYDPGTGLPNDTNFVTQLTMYSDDSGNTSATPSTTHIYGPYLRRPFPVNPTNKLATVKVKATPGTANPAAGTVGWVAVLSHGYFGISATSVNLDRFDLSVVERDQIVSK